MAECGLCGSENPSGNRFCRDCGASLTSTCPSCGAPVETGHRFCGGCGTALTTEAGPATRAAVDAGPSESTEVGPAQVTERRVCSVLFADLVGFTPLSESKDPEEVRELLSSYF